MYALESAMDELAAALNMDPVELRRVNDTMKDPITGRALFEPLADTNASNAAAEAFGWRNRSPAPGSMRDGDWLVGWGCATAVYPTQISTAAARVRLTPDGAARVSIAQPRDRQRRLYRRRPVPPRRGWGCRPTRSRSNSATADLPAGAGRRRLEHDRQRNLGRGQGLRRHPRAPRSTRPPRAARSPGVRRADFRLADGRIVAGAESTPIEAAFRTLGQSAIEEYAEKVPHGLTPSDIGGPVSRATPS